MTPKRSSEQEMISSSTVTTGLAHVHESSSAYLAAVEPEVSTSEEASSPLFSHFLLSLRASTMPSEVLYSQGNIKGGKFNISST